jgi:hypothetical protein
VVLARAEVDACQRAAGRTEAAAVADGSLNDLLERLPDRIPKYAVYSLDSHLMVAFAEERATPQTALTAYVPEAGPKLVVLPSVDAYACQRAAHCSGVEEIPAGGYRDMLEILPPVGFRNDGRAESFKCPEEIVPGIVDIFVNIEGRWFTFADSIGLPHAACCERVRASAAFARRPAEGPKR